MAGLVPAISLEARQCRARLIGIAGTDPAMTTEVQCPPIFISRFLSS
jgi:hypothetical protein